MYCSTQLSLYSISFYEFEDASGLGFGSMVMPPYKRVGNWETDVGGVLKLVRI
jgi:hypothetical protein